MNRILRLLVITTLGSFCTHARDRFSVNSANFGRTNPVEPGLNRHHAAREIRATE